MYELQVSGGLPMSSYVIVIDPYACPLIESLNPVKFIRPCTSTTCDLNELTTAIASVLFAADAGDALISAIALSNIASLKLLGS